jgi:hypothetical protein
MKATLGANAVSRHPREEITAPTIISFRFPSRLDPIFKTNNATNNDIRYISVLYSLAKSDINCLNATLYLSNI